MEGWYVLVVVCPSFAVPCNERLISKFLAIESSHVFSRLRKAFYIPPKLEQGMAQGGTFLFHGANTVYAHYDQSTGAHADIVSVLSLADNQLSAKVDASNVVPLGQ